MIQKLVTLLFLSGDPISVATLATLCEVSPGEITSHIIELETALHPLGLALLRCEDELSIVTQSAYAPLVESFWKEELKGELTPAALQVLTLVAYMGEPTREQISYIRGVQSSQSIRTLTVRGLLTRTGEVCVLSLDACKQLGITKPEELPDYETIHKELTEKITTREV